MAVNSKCGCGHFAHSSCLSSGDLSSCLWLNIYNIKYIQDTLVKIIIIILLPLGQRYTQVEKLCPKRKKKGDLYIEY